jgi:hypothetical protein
MGAGANAVLSQVADVLVNISQNCVATVGNQFQLDTGGAREVVIRGLDVTTTGSATMGRCQSTTTDVDIGPVHAAIDDRLEQVVRAAEQMEGDEVNFTVNIRESITADVVTNCTAVAVNTVRLLFRDVEESVLIDNVNIRQHAQAEMTRCIQNAQVRIGNDTRPLRQYLEEHEDHFEVDDGAGGAIRGGRRAHAKRYARPTCKTLPEAMLLLRVAAIASLACILIATGLLIREHRKQRDGPRP